MQRTLRRLARSPAPWLHGEVARRMAERLAWIRQPPASVLDWWAPIGGSEAVLRQALPGAGYTAVWPRDVERPAAAPWWSLRRRASPAAVDEGDVAPGRAALLWSNMGLHACSDPLAQMRRWLAALQVDGFLMFSTLGPGSLQRLRDLYASQGWPSPHAPFVDMHDLGDQLVAAGFAQPVMAQETLTLHWPDAAALLAELRTLGGNTDPGRFGGLRTPRWHARLCHALAAAARAAAEGDSRPRMDFEIVYGHAWRPGPRVQVRATATVSLADMRSILSGRSGA